MKTRFGTAPSNGRADATRLAWWLAVIAALITLQYVGRFSSGPAKGISPLYTWSFLGESIGQEIFFAAVILAIGGLSLRRFPFVRPTSVKTALRLGAVTLVVMAVFESVYIPLVDPGNEQGLVPAHWLPAHAAAYVANGIVICTLIPLVEEMTFRGVGFSLLQPFGERLAIVVTGILFALSHGLVLEFPVIAAFGLCLGYIRSRTESLWPGIALHGAFNLVGLVAAVTIGG